MAARTGHGMRAVTVNAVTAPASTIPISAPCRLCGWSIVASDIAGLVNTGTVTSPAAGASVASLASVPSGDYSVSWEVELGGTLAAADANNFGLFVGAAQVAQSLNPAVAGIYQQEAVSVVVPPGGATVAVKAINLGTVAAVYTATEALPQIGTMQGQILDGGQVLGVIGPPAGGAETRMLSREGIYVSGAITVQAVQGTLSGVLYVTDFDADEERRKWHQTRFTSSP